MDLLSLIDLKDVIGLLLGVLRELFEVERLEKALKKIMNLLIFLSDSEELITLLLLKLLELTVEVALQLEDDLLKELDLGALSGVSVQLIGLVKELESRGTIKGSLDVINAALGLNNAPVDLLHTLNVARTTLLGEGSKASFFIRVTLARLCSELTLGDRKDRLQFAVTIHLDRLVAVLVGLFLGFTSSGLLEDASSLGDRVVIEELGLARDAIEDIVLKATVIGLIDHLYQLLLHTLELLSQFNLPLHANVPVETLL